MIWRTTSGLRAVALLLALALTASACGRPRDPLDVGVKEFPSDIVLGNGTEAALELPVPVPPNSLALAPSLVLGTPVVSTPPRVPTPPVACPEADAFAVPDRLATSDVIAPPIAASYVYRNEGTFEIGGANAMRGAFPNQATRVVANVARSDPKFTFDVVSTLGDTVTTSSYLVAPVGSQEFPGIYVTKVTSKSGTAAQTTFDPTPDLEFLRFPVEPGTAWQSSGVDSTTLQAVTFSAVVEPRVRIDACGAILDVVSVKVNGDVVQCVIPPDEVRGTPAGTPVCPGVDASGRGASPRSGAREQFSGRYLWGTQYGGLVLRDTVDVITDQPGGSVSRRNTATITKTPATP